MTNRFVIFTLAALLLGGAVGAEVVFTDPLSQQPDLQWYAAEFESLYDADTIDVHINLGFGVELRKQRLRLYGIDAWEMTGEEKPKGKKAKKFVEKLIRKKPLLVRSTYPDKTRKLRGKYGRLLVEMFVQVESRPAFTDRGGTWHPAEERWVNLSKRLVEEGHAEIVDY